MIIKLVNEEDDNDFHLLDIEDDLIEKLRSSFQIENDEELMSLIKHIIMKELENDEQESNSGSSGL